MTRSQLSTRVVMSITRSITSWRWSSEAITCIPSNIARIAAVVVPLTTPSAVIAESPPSDVSLATLTAADVADADAARSSCSCFRRLSTRRSAWSRSRRAWSRSEAAVASCSRSAITRSSSGTRLRRSDDSVRARSPPLEGPSADDDAAVDAPSSSGWGARWIERSSACGTSSPAARASTDARSRLFCVYSRACSASPSERRRSWGADVGRWLKLICGCKKVA